MGQAERKGGKEVGNERIIHSSQMCTFIYFSIKNICKYVVRARMCGVIDKLLCAKEESCYHLQDVEGWVGDRGSLVSNASAGNRGQYIRN